MILEKEITCCFSGHRPVAKMNEKYFNNEILRNELKDKLTNFIIQAINLGYVNFITGMAKGSDLLFAECVLEQKQNYPNIKLEGAIPCLNQDSDWEENDKRLYNNILEKLDKITYVSSLSYTNGCMLKRNRYMVSKSSLLITIWNGEKSGGTYYTYKLAINDKLKIFEIRI
jgi:uncharacterized phage-like protein YoqJ